MINGIVIKKRIFSLMIRLTIKRKSIVITLLSAISFSYDVSEILFLILCFNPFSFVILIYSQS